MPRILVVEDSRTQAEELRLILEPEGFVVEIARDGQEALDRLGAAPFDLVLSDVLMPGLTGYDLCRQIKAASRTKGVPVVLLTHLNDPLDVLRGLECGADNFLTKPYDPRYLLHRIHSILANAGAAGEGPAGTPLFFRGKGVSITADKAQILDLLLATVEEFIRSREREREARAAGEALAESGRRKDEFLAMLAHELRNPLAPLLTGLHVLRHGAEAAAREQALDAAERQVRHLARLVDDLLDASRINAGRMQLRRERLDLARLVRTVAEDHRPALEEAGLVLTVATPDVPVWAQGDDTRLSQAVHNLLDNATKFSEVGGQVALQVVVSEGGEEACVAVRDTGIGIEAEALPGLFDAFTQADRTLARARGGLGLGLAVVKGVIALHGGRVRAFSEGPGRGAELTFFLPMEQEPPALAVETTRRKEAPPRACGRLRVVVVEDNKDAANNLRILLEAMGHEVAVAYTGPEGVRIAGELRPSVVISDIGLPGLDGYGVAAALRRDPGTARALLIAISGYGEDADVRRGREAGFDHYLIKPAPPEDLLRLLAAV